MWARSTMSTPDYSDQDRHHGPPRVLAAVVTLVLLAAHAPTAAGLTSPLPDANANCGCTAAAATFTCSKGVWSDAKCWSAGAVPTCSAVVPAGVVAVVGPAAKDAAAVDSATRQAPDAVVPAGPRAVQGASSSPTTTVQCLSLSGTLEVDAGWEMSITSSFAWTAGTVTGLGQLTTATDSAAVLGTLPACTTGAGAADLADEAGSEPSPARLDLDVSTWTIGGSLDAGPVQLTIASGGAAWLLSSATATLHSSAAILRGGSGAGARGALKIDKGALLLVGLPSAEQALAASVATDAVAGAMAATCPAPQVVITATLAVDAATVKVAQAGATLVLSSVTATAGSTLTSVTGAHLAISGAATAHSGAVTVSGNIQGRPTFTVAANSTCTITASVNVAPESKVTVNGTLSIGKPPAASDAAALDAPAPVAAARRTLAVPELAEVAVSATMATTSSLLWSGGTLSGTGSVVIQQGTSLQLQGGAKLAPSVGTIAGSLVVPQGAQGSVGGAWTVKPRGSLILHGSLGVDARRGGGPTITIDPGTVALLFPGAVLQGFPANSPSPLVFIDAGASLVAPYLAGTARTAAVIAARTKLNGQLVALDHTTVLLRAPVEMTKGSHLISDGTSQMTLLGGADMANGCVMRLSAAFTSSGSAGLSVGKGATLSLVTGTQLRLATDTAAVVEGAITINGTASVGTGYDVEWLGSRLSGSGTLEVAPGSTAMLGEGVSLGVARTTIGGRVVLNGTTTAPAGTVSVRDGASLEVGGTLAVSGGEVVVESGGTVQLQAGSHVAGASSRVGTSAQLQVEKGGLLTVLPQTKVNATHNAAVTTFTSIAGVATASPGSSLLLYGPTQVLAGGQLTVDSTSRIVLGKSPVQTGKTSVTGTLDVGAGRWHVSGSGSTTTLKSVALTTLPDTGFDVNQGSVLQLDGDFSIAGSLAVTGSGDVALGPASVVRVEGGSKTSLETGLLVQGSLVVAGNATLTAPRLSVAAGGSIQVAPDALVASTSRTVTLVSGTPTNHNASLADAAVPTAAANNCSTTAEGLHLLGSSYQHASLTVPAGCRLQSDAVRVAHGSVDIAGTLAATAASAAWDFGGSVVTWAPGGRFEAPGDASLQADELLVGDTAPLTAQVPHLTLCAALRCLDDGSATAGAVVGASGAAQATHSCSPTVELQGTSSLSLESGADCVGRFSGGHLTVKAADAGAALAIGSTAAAGAPYQLTDASLTSECPLTVNGGMNATRATITAPSADFSLRTGTGTALVGLSSALHVADAAKVVSGAVEVLGQLHASSVAMDGGSLCFRDLDAPLTNSAGTLHTCDGYVDMTMGSSYDQLADATLDVTVDSEVVGTYTSINVAGKASLLGSVSVSSVLKVLPTGFKVPVLTAHPLESSFSQVEGKVEVLYENQTLYIIGQCGPGTKVGPNKIGCTACTAGRFAQKPASVTCEQCAPGSYSEEKAAECTPCAAGTFAAAAGATSCDTCGKDTFQTQTGQTACDQCPANTKWLDTNGGPTTAASCECLPGFWRYSPVGAAACERCPVTAACLGGEGEDGCAEGYVGLLCSSCDHSANPRPFYKLGLYCHECPSASIMIYIGAFAGLLTVTSTVVLFKQNITKVLLSLRKTSLDRALWMVLNSLQSVYLVARINVSWPPTVRRMFTFLALMAVDVEFVSPQCVSEIKANAEYLLELALPLMLAGVLTLSFLLVRGVSLLRGKTGRHAGHDFIFFGGYVWFLSYATLTAKSLSVFDCTKPAGVDNHILVSNGRIQCYTGEWWGMMGGGLAGLIVYAFGIPMFVGYVLLSARKKWHSFSHGRFEEATFHARFREFDSENATTRRRNRQGGQYTRLGGSHDSRPANAAHRKLALQMSPSGRSLGITDGGDLTLTEADDIDVPDPVRPTVRSEVADVPVSDAGALGWRYLDFSFFVEGYREYWWALIELLRKFMIAVMSVGIAQAALVRTLLMTAMLMCFLAFRIYKSPARCRHIGCTGERCLALPKTRGWCGRRVQAVAEEKIEWFHQLFHLFMAVYAIGLAVIDNPNNVASDIVGVLLLGGLIALCGYTFFAVHNVEHAEPVLDATLVADKNVAKVLLICGICGCHRRYLAKKLQRQRQKLMDDARRAVHSVASPPGGGAASGDRQGHDDAPAAGMSFVAVEPSAPEATDMGFGLSLVPEATAPDASEKGLVDGKGPRRRGGKRATTPTYSEPAHAPAVISGPPGGGGAGGGFGAGGGHDDGVALIQDGRPGSARPYASSAASIASVDSLHEGAKYGCGGFLPAPTYGTALFMSCAFFGSLVVLTMGALLPPEYVDVKTGLIFAALAALVVLVVWWAIDAVSLGAMVHVVNDGFVRKKAKAARAGATSLASETVRVLGRL